MSIQSTINQGMSVAALLFSQSDFAKETRDIRMAEKNINKLSAIGKEADYGISQYVEGAGTDVSAADLKENLPEFGIAARTREQIAEQRQKIAELKPSKENIGKYTAAAEDAGEYSLVNAYKNPSSYTFGPREGALYGYTKKQKQDAAKASAADALTAEAERIAATPSFDLSKLAEGPRARVERAYKKAERDTKYLSKKEDTK